MLITSRRWSSQVNLLLHNQQGAAETSGGGKAEAWRTPQVGARAVVAVVIGKVAIQQQDFLATAMSVVGEAAVWGLALHQGGTSHLGAPAIEQATLHPQLRRWRPGPTWMGRPAA